MSHQTSLKFAHTTLELIFQIDVKSVLISDMQSRVSLSIADTSTDWQQISSRVCFANTLAVTYKFEDPDLVSIRLIAEDGRCLAIGQFDIEECLPSTGVQVPMTDKDDRSVATCKIMRIKVSSPIVIYWFKDVRLLNKDTGKDVEGCIEVDMCKNECLDEAHKDAAVKVRLPEFSVFDTKCYPHWMIMKHTKEQLCFSGFESYATAGTMIAKLVVPDVSSLVERESVLPTSDPNVELRIGNVEEVVRPNFVSQLATGISFQYHFFVTKPTYLQLVRSKQEKAKIYTEFKTAIRHIRKCVGGWGKYRGKVLFRGSHEDTDQLMDHSGSEYSYTGLSESMPTSPDGITRFLTGDVTDNQPEESRAERQIKQIDFASGAEPEKQTLKSLTSPRGYNGVDQIDESSLKTLEEEIAEHLAEVKLTCNQEDLIYNMFFIIIDSSSVYSDLLPELIEESAKLPISLVFLSDSIENLKKFKPLTERKTYMRKNAVLVSLDQVNFDGLKAGKAALVRLPQQIDEYIFEKERAESEAEMAAIKLLNDQ